MSAPTALSLCHVALRVQALEACAVFYGELLGMKIVWQPDADNIYLSTGTDNLALHRTSVTLAATAAQTLDHLGFTVPTLSAVDDWYAYLTARQVPVSDLPKDHRDGSRSFYCLDPAGNSVQIMYLPL